MLVSSIVTITVEESYSTSKADKIREGAKDVKEDIEEGIKKLGKINNKYNNNDNQNIQNEFDNLEDTEDTSSNNNNNNDKVSIADELRELAQLKTEGVITEEEFADMKEDLIE
jgi:hypothetical protein